MKILLLIICAFSAGLTITKFAGPIFITRQKSSLEFLNTDGKKLDCLAHGDPDPKIEWYRALPDGRQEEITDVPSMRKIFSNGSMVLKRFSPDRYSQDVHAATYRCIASNIHGSIISVPVSIRAITKRRKQRIQAQVYDEYVISGNTAVLRCHIPTFFKDDLEVIAWVREDNHIIHRNHKDDDRYTVTETGNLHIRNVLSTQDQQLGYWCQIQNRFTDETFLSQTAGKVILTEPHGTVLPTITDIIETIFVEKGKSAKLSCAAQGNPPPNYRWIKPDGTTISGEGILTVTGTELTGSYEYRCMVNNSNGEDTRPTFVIVTETLSAFITQKKSEDENGIQLMCHTSGYPVNSISWTLNGKPIDTASSQQDKDRIVIKNAGRKDRGMYQCFVSNQWDTVQGTLQLKLGDFAPSFMKTFASRTLQPGPSTELECSGIGRPIPVIEWLRNGNKIFEGDNVRIKETVGKDGSVKSRLTVKNVKVEDGAEYVCKVSNKLGSDSHSDRINIYGLPIVQEINDITVGQGQFVTVNCYVSGFPIKSIQWTRANSKSYMPSTSETLTNGTLIIHKVAKRDQGRYMCTASNGGGQSDSKIVFIKILLKPKIDLPVPLSNLPEGGSVLLTCTVIQGDDPVNLTWKRNGKLMRFGKGTDLTTTKLYSLIQIRKLDYSHRGTYTCLAENPAGKTEKSVEVTISVAPKWKKEPKDVNTVVGEDVKITCAADGNPNPSTEWFKLDMTRLSIISRENSKYKFDNNKTTLVIRNINKLDHESRYRCVVTNGIMSDLVKEITIKVDSVSFTIENLPKYSSAFNGTKWTLVCNVEDVMDNHKHIQMAWLKDLNILSENNSERIKFKRRQKKLQLVINPLKFEDEGMYACQVSDGNEVKVSEEARLKVLHRRVEHIINTSTGRDLFQTTEMTLQTTKNQIVLNPDYDKEAKQRQGDAVVESTHEMEQNQLGKIIKGETGSKLESNDDKKSANINQIIVFVVPAAVVLILLIAVVSTLIAYLVLKRSAKNNRRPSQTYKHQENSITHDNDYASRKENVIFIPSSANTSIDRRYGRLKSSGLKYGAGGTQNTYEIPDYCGGIKPYSTLQFSHETNKKMINDNRDSQCSI